MRTTSRFMLTHRHTLEECAIAFAAWKGFESPLRHRTALSTCASLRVGAQAGRDGRHHLMWWIVEAGDETAAIALLPPYLAERTEATEASDVWIP